MSTRTIDQAVVDLVRTADWYRPGNPSAAVGHPELDALARAFDGLVGYGGALRVFGQSPGPLPTQHEWNRADGWIGEYPDLPAGLVVFAENFLGEQFAITAEGVIRIDLETGATEQLAPSVSQFLSNLRTDPVEIGPKLLQAWERLNGRLDVSHYLSHPIPFVIGGSYNPEEMVATERYDLMRFRASFASQIRDLPDGATVRLRVE
jgi:hypothetical protein